MYIPKVFIEAPYTISTPYYVCIVYWIKVNLKNLKTTLINRTRLRTKGQSAGYPQAQIGSTPNFFQRRAHTTHVSSIQDYICDSWCLSVH